MSDVLGCLRRQQLKSVTRDRFTATLCLRCGASATVTILTKARRKPTSDDPTEVLKEFPSEPESRPPQKCPASIQIYPEGSIDATWKLEEPASFPSLAFRVRQCGKVKALSDGKRLHALICNYGYEHDTFLGNCLIDMYGKCGRLDYARAVFDNITVPNSYSWNIFLKVYTQNGNLEGAQQLFDRIPEPDLYSWNTLINVYGESGNVDSASILFSRMPHRNTVSWTAMMAAYVQNGYAKKALELFHQMQLENSLPDEITFLCCLGASASLAALEDGQWIHYALMHTGVENVVSVANALINMYGKCSSLDDAWSAFGHMPHRDAVSWTSMVRAFAENGHSREALDLYRRMLCQNVELKKPTFICTLNACTDLVALKEGQDIHVTIMNWYGQYDVMVENALVTMYGKCGSVRDAVNVFGKIPDRNVISWTAMIDVYAHNGHSKEALNLFGQMQHEGINPNAITFICILTACSHTGHIEEGKRWFILMNKEYGIIPTGDHFLCLIDILGRAGHLDEAENLINQMPCEKIYIAWFCLLVVCKVHGDFERGLRAAAHCFKMDSKNMVPYAILSNILPEAVCA